jgi:hypothetical protein
MTNRRWAIGLLCVSAALLAYELLLMRLLALAYWGHFAGMVISIAMLGIASSGLFLFFARERVGRNPEKFFAISAGIFGVAAPLAFILSQRLPFTPFLLTWSAREYGLLAARSLLFFSAFFAAGIAIGVPFVARVLPMGRLYFWNMLGSGLPALPLLLAMNFAHPMRLLAAVAVVAIAVPVICTGRTLIRAGWAAAALGVIACHRRDAVPLFRIQGFAEDAAAAGFARGGRAVSMGWDRADRAVAAHPLRAGIVAELRGDGSAGAARFHRCGCDDAGVRAAGGAREFRLSADDAGSVFICPHAGAKRPAFLRRHG